MEKNKIKFKKGFSLFELVIVLGIISILSGISFSYYNKFSEGKKLESEAKKMANILSLASKKSSSGDQASCNDLTGYRVYLSSGGNQWNYVLQRCCGGGVACSEELTDITTYELPQNITVSTPSTTILFRKLGQEAIIDSNQSIESTTVRMKNNSLDSKNCIDISVNKVGIIEIGARIDCS